jgi:ABC-type enterochelin transport system permease subunit
VKRPFVSVSLQNVIHPFGTLLYHVYNWQRKLKVWLDGSFDDLVARDVEVKTDEFYKYVYSLGFN